MRNVFSFIKPYKLPTAVALILMLIELSVELLLPLFLGLMINQGVMNQDVSQIIFWGSIMIGLALLAFIAGILNSFYSSHVSFSFGYDLRQKLFEKIQHFSFANLSDYPSSAIVTRFTNDIRQIQNMVFMGLRFILKSPLIVIGGVTMAFIINARLAAIFLITVPLLILFLLWVMRKASSKFSGVQKNVDQVNQVMQENLSGIRLIKAFTRSDFEENRFTKANQNLADSSKNTFRFVEASMPVLLFIMNLSLVFILWFGSIESVAGQTNVGEVVTIVNYALRVTMSINVFSFIVMLLSRTKASSERVDELLSIDVSTNDEQETKQKQTIENGKVDYDHVSFVYPGTSKEVLQNISFTIPASQRLAIIGATGSGKTSIFQLLPRLYDSTDGAIYIDGQPISAYSNEGLRKSIGYVPQNPLLFTGTIKDNIAWGKNKATKNEIIQAAKDAQIHDTIMDLPDHYETRVGQKGVNLSGGQKQRISIARALVRNPKILMLDDSTSALDLATESRLLQAIQKYECTTLMITQKISTAKQADRILLMDEGKTLAFGTHDELIRSSSLYLKIVESQYGKEYVHASE